MVFIKEEETLTSEDIVTPVGALLTKVETFVISVELVTVPLKEYCEIWGIKFVPELFSSSEVKPADAEYRPLSIKSE